MAREKRMVKIQKISKTTGNILGSATMWTDKSDFEIRLDPLFSETKLVWFKITEL